MLWKKSLRTHGGDFDKMILKQEAKWIYNQTATVFPGFNTAVTFKPFLQVIHFLFGIPWVEWLWCDIDYSIWAVLYYVSLYAVQHLKMLICKACVILAGHAIFWYSHYMCSFHLHGVNLPVFDSVPWTGEPLIGRGDRFGLLVMLPLCLPCWEGGSEHSEDDQIHCTCARMGSPTTDITSVSHAAQSFPKGSCL